MSELSLTSVFSKSEDALKTELSKFYLPRDYVSVQQTINNHILKLFSEDNEFKNSLNVSDAELLNAALRMALSFQQLTLSESIDFKALSIKTTYEIEKNDGKEDNNDIVENTISLLPTVICAFINPWLALAVGGGTVLAKRIVKTKSGGRKEIQVREKKTDVSHKITTTEINAIIESIQNLCTEIDGIIAKIQRDRKDLISQMQDKLNDCSIEKMYPQILTSVQYLAKEDMTSENKNPYVQNIIFNLQGYGYEVVDYNPSTKGFFSKKSNPNVEEETMYLPAIIKDVEGIKVVVAEGIVYIPVNVKQ